MRPGPPVDRAFVTRVTLIVAVPIASLSTWASLYGDQTDIWPVLVALLIATFAFAFLFALGTWYFLVRPKQVLEPETPLQPVRGSEPGSSDTIEYVAHYSESNTRTSERAFVRRGLRELWLMETLAGPLSAAFVLAIGHVAGAGTWFFVAFGALGCLLIVRPAFLLVTRPALAAAGARRLPSVVIAFRPEGLVLRGNSAERTYPWRTIRKLWDVGPHYVLAAERHIGVHLPKEGLPAGALDYVRSHAALPPSP